MEGMDVLNVDSERDLNSLLFTLLKRDLEGDDQTKLNEIKTGADIAAGTGDSLNIVFQSPIVISLMEKYDIPDSLPLDYHINKILTLDIIPENIKPLIWHIANCNKQDTLQVNNALKNKLQAIASFIEENESNSFGEELTMIYDLKSSFAHGRKIRA